MYLSSTTPKMLINRDSRWKWFEIIHFKEEITFKFIALRLKFVIKSINNKHAAKALYTLQYII